MTQPELDREAQATPIADAAEFEAIHESSNLRTVAVVESDVARDLERALTAATARAEEAERITELFNRESQMQLQLRKDTESRLAALEAALEELVKADDDLRYLDEMDAVPADVNLMDAIERNQLAWEAARKVLSALPDAGKEERHE